MTQVAIDLPESVFSALRLSPHEFAAEMRVAAAVQWYGERRISQGKAAEVAGLSRAAFLDELRRRGVSAIQVDASELEGELDDA
jgi:predicted HTH domain antitoxin